MVQRSGLLLDRILDIVVQIARCRTRLTPEYAQRYKVAIDTLINQECNRGDRHGTARFVCPVASAADPD